MASNRPVHEQEFGLPCRPESVFIHVKGLSVLPSCSLFVSLPSSMEQQEIFNRSQLLLGNDGMDALQRAGVIIFGVGGVGSWCAEGLVRAGLTHLTIVDSDTVCQTNINRQLMATHHTLGKAKVDAMKERLLDINPKAEITAINALYSTETADRFVLNSYDYVIDCIDSLSDKCDLILRTTSLSRPTLLCSMGAALRIDPTRIRLTEFSKVQGDALARAVRNKFKRNKTFPQRKFLCVYSEEPAMQNYTDDSIIKETPSFNKVQVNGSLCHITSIFGMMLAGRVIQSIVQKAHEP